MSEDYLSFINFTREDLVGYLKKIPKKILSYPIANNKKFSKEVGIKGFRQEAYKIDVLRKIYVKEILNNKQSILGIALLGYEDGMIKSKVSEKDYEILKSKDIHDSNFINVLEKVMLLKVENNNYLLKMLCIDEEFSDKIKCRLGELNYRKLKDENDSLKRRFEELENKRLDLEKINENLFEQVKKNKEKRSISEKNEIESLQNEKLLMEEKIQYLERELMNANRISNEVDVNDIITRVLKSIENEKFVVLQELIKDINIFNDTVYEELYNRKQKAVFEKNNSYAKNICLLEYIILEIKEIQNNE